MNKKRRFAGFIFDNLIRLYLWAALRKHQNLATRAVRGTLSKRLPLGAVVTTYVRKKIKK